MFYLSRFCKKAFFSSFLSWKFFFLCNFLVFFLKIVYSFHSGFQASYFEDWDIAENLVNHHVYSRELLLGATAYKLPMYPLFLSFFISLFGVAKAVKFIVLFQHFFYFLIPCFLVKIFANFRVEKAGFLSAYLFLLSPAYFYYSNVLEATNLFLPLFAFWMLRYSGCWFRKFSSFDVVVFSFFTALLALTQVVAVLVLVFLFFLLIFRKKLSISRMLMVCVLTGIFYSPWVVRNALVFDRIVVSKSPVWQNIYLGYAPEYQIIDNHFITQKQLDEVFQKTKPCNEFEDEVIFKSNVCKIISTNKYAPFQKGLNNIISLWYVPNTYFKQNTLSVLIGRKLYVLLLNFLFLVGLAYFFKTDRFLFFVSIVLCFLFTLPYLVGHAANIRFKLDFEWLELSFVSYFLFLFFSKRCKGF